MLRRISFCGAVLALVAPLSAQQLAPPEPNQAAIKFQVKNFESTLRMAVERGGRAVGDQAREIVPGVELMWLSDVGVSGWWTVDLGYTFDVVIPDIGATSALAFRRVQEQTPAPSPVKPVAGNGPNSGRTASGASITNNNDPMVASPVVPFDPIQVFSDKVRQALIDALVDNSGALQFAPGQRMVVSAGPAPQMVPNPLGPDSRKLILTVRGEDLVAFRQGKLKRDELIALIKESRF